MRAGQLDEVASPSDGSPSEDSGRLLRLRRLRRLGTYLSAYVVLTLALFLVAGRVQEAAEPLAMTLYVLVSVALFLATYRNSVGHYTLVAMGWRTSKMSKHLPAVTLAGCIYLGLYYLTLLRTAGITLQDISSGINSLGGAYNSRSSLLGTDLVSPLLSAMNLFGILGLAGLVTLPMTWKVLSPWLRSICMVSIFPMVAYSLAIGTFKLLGDVVIAVIVGTYIGRMQRHAGTVGERTNIRAAWTIALVVTFTGAAVFGFADRLFSKGLEGNAVVNPFLASIFPPFLATGLSQVLYYPIHGYLGLSYALQAPFEWSRGLGSSPAVARLASDYLGLVPPTTNYRERITAEFGWQPNQWATAYTDWASDITFVGVLVALVLLGWLLARSLADAVATRSIVASVLALQCITVVLWIPANNQVAQTSLGLITFVETLVLYLAIAIHRSISRSSSETDDALRIARG